jgi:hypothetical protein
MQCVNIMRFADYRGYEFLKSAPGGARFDDVFSRHRRNVDPNQGCAVEAELPSP